MRRFLALVGLFWIPLASVHGNPRHSLTDLVEFKNLRSLTISPDGATVAAVVTTPILTENRNQSDLWFMPLKDGPARRIDFGATSVDQALWSPKGDRIAVVGGIKGEAGQILWVLGADGTNPRRIATIDRGNHYLAHQGANLCWSPDGASIAYLAADRPRIKAAEPMVVSRIQYKTRTSFSDNRPSHLWIVDVATGKSRQLTTGAGDYHSIDWSPKGDELVACSNREPDPDANWNNDLVVIKVASGEVAQLTKTRGNEMTPVWNPDGSQIAFTMTKRPLTTIDSVAEDAHVWVADRKTGKARELAPELDRRCSHLRWAADGSHVFSLIRDRGNVRIVRIPSNGEPAKEVFLTDGMISDYAISPTGVGTCVLSKPTVPPELYTFKPTGGEPSRKSSFNSAAAERWKLIAPRRIECKSFDGVPLEGWLMLPPSASKSAPAPVILNIHGGPHGMHGNAFSPSLQLYCDRGYAVLSLNPRGSTGYGQKFSDGCLNDWGGADFKDLIAGLEHALKTNPELDGNRLGVTGGSYGGYMTNWVITQDNRFKAAVSYAGLSNLISFYATSLYQDLVHVEFGGMPWDRYEILWDRSPLKHIKKAKTPTLILHGEADFDVHISQSEELYTALKWLGVDSVFVRYPRQGHGASEPRQQVDLLERTIGWFDRYLTANEK